MIPKRQVIPRDTACGIDVYERGLETFAEGVGSLLTFLRWLVFVK
jgi:hypothetical protein